MTQYTDITPTGGTDAPSTTDVAKDEAKNVGQTAAQAGSQVASTAADQAKQVTQETRRQAQDLLTQGRSQASEQMRNGQQQAASGLSTLAGELRSMTDHSDDSSDGPAHDLVRQATDKADELAEWLRSREPGDLLDEVRRFARRRPGAFLLGAALTGVVAGRLTTGVVAAHKDENEAGGSPQHGFGAGAELPAPVSQPMYQDDPYATGQPVVDPYGAPAVPAYADAPTAEYPSQPGEGYQSQPGEGYQSPSTTGYQSPDADGYPHERSDVPPLPYGTPPPGSESNWADPQRPQDDGTRL